MELVLSMGDFAAYSPVVIRPVGPTTSICLSGDGKELVTGLQDGRLFLYDLPDGQKRGEFEAFESQVQSITLTNDSRRLTAVIEVARHAFGNMLITIGS